MTPVTCIIPVRNGEKTIERAVESAIAAGCDYVSIFDDASTDKTPEILGRIVKHPEVRWPSGYGPIRSGVSFARNFLIRTAADGLIIPLDCDDTLNDIKPLKTACGENTWVYGNYLEIDGRHETLIKGSPAGALARKELTGITFMFHKSDWLKVGGFDPDFAFAEDYAFQCALTNAGVQPVYVDHVVYNRHLRPEGNERTVLAGVYWDFYHKLAQHKYQNLFAMNH